LREAVKSSQNQRAMMRKPKPDTENWCTGRAKTV
jgi:hypothetical protein